MRTSRALTVSGVGVGVGASQKEGIFWGEKKLKKKRKKNFGDPPENLETPQKIWRPPPENVEPPPKIWRPLWKFGEQPLPPPVDRILDTRFWKYYLGPTSLRPVINSTVKQNLIWGNKNKSRTGLLGYAVSVFF